MRKLVPFIVLLALASGVEAAHCTTWDTASPDVNAADRLYFDLDTDGVALFSFWVYEETNGLPGLQRHDEVVDNTCHGMIPGDTIWI